MANMLDLKDYRQPFVTSLGVILAFLVGFMGQWVTEDNFQLHDVNDKVLFWGCSCAVLLLLIALFRMLIPGIAAERMWNYYLHSLWLYVTGVVMAFASMMLSAFL